MSGLTANAGNITQVCIVSVNNQQVQLLRRCLYINYYTLFMIYSSKQPKSQHLDNVFSRSLDYLTLIQR